jgi:hypothetical protein
MDEHCEIMEVRNAGAKVLESLSSQHAKYLQELGELRSELDASEAKNTQMKLERDGARGMDLQLAVQFRESQEKDKRALSESKAAQLQASVKLENAYVELRVLKVSIFIKAGLIKLLMVINGRIASNSPMRERRSSVEGGIKTLVRR